MNEVDVEAGSRKTSLRHRLVKGLMAQSMGQATSLLIQLIQIPLFLTFWGKSLMGEWLLLSAVPAYLQISDLSFGTAAANEMTMLESANRRPEVQRIYHSTFLFVLGTCAVIALVSFPAIFLLPIDRIFGLTLLSLANARLALLLMVVWVILTQFTGIYFAAYRCSGHFAAGTMVNNLLRVGEFVATAVVLVMHGGVVAVAAAMLGVRVVGVLLQDLHVRKLVPWLKAGIKDADRTAIKTMLVPALTFNAFPIGQAMNLQGVLFVVGRLFGAEAVTAFTIVRTLARTAYQLATIVSNVAWDELSRAFGAQDFELAARLHRRACQVGLWVACFAALGLATVGPWIHGAWTRHRVQLDYGLLLWLLGVSVLYSLWSISYVVPVSFNRHSKLALLYVLISTATVGFAYAMGTALGIHGVAATLLISEACMVLVVVNISVSLVRDRQATFFKTVLTPPSRWALEQVRTFFRLRTAKVGAD